MKSGIIVALFFILALPASSQDTVQVKMGWNLVGSVTDGAVPDVLTTTPPGIIVTSFFGYSPLAGYSSTDTLEKGLGYWVRVSADGLIVFEGIVSPDPLVCGIKTVTYGGVIYRTVKIGNQCWLDRNLNIGTMISAGNVSSDNGVIEKYCHDNDSTNCLAYGGFYSWDEAMRYVTTEGVQGICPPGWHLPAQAEYATLASMITDNGNALKELGEGAGSPLGTDASGFSALLAGAGGLYGTFENPGMRAFFWSSTLSNEYFPYYLFLYYTSGGVFIENHVNKDFGFSVRCLED